jgi:hypothetical protein
MATQKSNAELFLLARGALPSKKKSSQARNEEKQKQRVIFFFFFFKTKIISF